MAEALTCVQSYPFLKYSDARLDKHPYVTENLHRHNLQGGIMVVL